MHRTSWESSGAKYKVDSKTEWYRQKKKRKVQSRMQNKKEWAGVRGGKRWTRTKRRKNCPVH